MITYQENKNNIIQKVEIDLTKIPRENRQDLESRLTAFLNYIGHKNLFDYTKNKLTYQTEVLLPKINKNRINLLMVVGNPALHSVAEGMFFSYQRTAVKGKWSEHRFWKGLRECGILKFRRTFKTPSPENIGKLNKLKRDCLLTGNYKSNFNLFLLTYFSFPTPSTGKYNGVGGIKKVIGGDLFAELKEFELQRFKGIVLSNNIKYVLCFQKDVLDEIKSQVEYEQIDDILDKPIYRINNLKTTLYAAGSTRLILGEENKKILKEIVFDIKRKGSF